MLRAKINKGYSVIVELINLARVVGRKIRTGSVILACSPKKQCAIKRLTAIFIDGQAGGDAWAGKPHKRHAESRFYNIKMG